VDRVRTHGKRALDHSVGGGLDDGEENAPLVPELAKRFTVTNYARRGRGESGDTLPYGLEREIEDIEALLMEARIGRSAAPPTHSSSVRRNSRDQRAGVGVRFPASPVPRSSPSTMAKACGDSSSSVSN
jgi:hypothetical protein